MNDSTAEQNRNRNRNAQNIKTTTIVNLLERKNGTNGNHDGTHINQIGHDGKKESSQGSQRDTQTSSWHNDRQKNSQTHSHSRSTDSECVKGDRRQTEADG